MHEETGKMWDIIEGTHECMVVDMFTGGLRARPMAHIPEREAGVIWFVTARDSGKVDEIEKNPEICMTIKDGSDYASVTGLAEVIEDQAKLKELWSTPIDAWFPDGPEGGRACLLRMTPTVGEYWDTPGTVVSGIKMALASIRDEQPDLGENEKVRFGAT